MKDVHTSAIKRFQRPSQQPANIQQLCDWQDCDLNWLFPQVTQFLARYFVSIVQGHLHRAPSNTRRNLSRHGGLNLPRSHSTIMWCTVPQVTHLMTLPCRVVLISVPQNTEHRAVGVFALTYGGPHSQESKSKGQEREGRGRTAGSKVVYGVACPSKTPVHRLSSFFIRVDNAALGGPAEFIPGQANLFPSALVAQSKASLPSLENCWSLYSTKSSLQTQGKLTASDHLTGVTKHHPFPLSCCRESHMVWLKLVSD